MRSWLIQNATTKREVFVYCIRRPHLTILAYLDVVEKALCFGWIDSVCLHCEKEGYFQRISTRRKGSLWTKLNKERCRRLIRLEMMTPAGRKISPSLAKNSFRPDPWIINVIKADQQAWRHHRQFPPLYVHVRLYNIQWCYHHLSSTRSLAMLE